MRGQDLWGRGVASLKGPSVLLRDSYLRGRSLCMSPQVVRDPCASCTKEAYVELPLVVAVRRVARPHRALAIAGRVAPRPRDPTPSLPDCRPADSSED